MDLDDGTALMEVVIGSVAASVSEESVAANVTEEYVSANGTEDSVAGKVENEEEGNDGTGILSSDVGEVGVDGAGDKNNMGDKDGGTNECTWFF